MKIIAVESGDVRLQLVAPPRDLAPYISLYYRTDVAPGAVVEDLVPPEWANLRVGRGQVYEAAMGAGALRPVPSMVVSGPTSRASRLRIGEGHYWGIGLLPLGFVKLLAIPASDYADRFRPVAEEPAAEPLLPMLAQLLGQSGPMEGPVAMLNERFRTLLSNPLPQAVAIQAVHRAVVSDHVQSVASLVRETHLSTRTLERFCRRTFGFNPQLLLRRQRFLRSLASFMVDPSMNWIRSLDSHYHDHAHFVRDFRWFMGIRPSDYAAMEHPVTAVVVRARHALRGEAMQLLHQPDPPAVA